MEEGQAASRFIWELEIRAPQGPKPHLIAPITARLKQCPDANHRFSQILLIV
jgi:hypothetical protein